MLKDFKQIIKIVSTVSVFVVILGLVVMGIFFPDNFGQMLIALSTFISAMSTIVIDSKDFLKEFNLVLVVQIVAYAISVFFISTIITHIVRYHIINIIKDLKKLNDKDNNENNQNTTK